MNHMHWQNYASGNISAKPTQYSCLHVHIYGNPSREFHKNHTQMNKAFPAQLAIGIK